MANVINERYPAEVRAYLDSVKESVYGRANPQLHSQPLEDLYEKIKEQRGITDLLCAKPYNEARECLFQATGNAHTCNKFITEFTYCSRDPENYKQFLKRSTKNQKKDVVFNFDMFPGTNAKST